MLIAIEFQYMESANLKWGRRELSTEEFYWWPEAKKLDPPVNVCDINCPYRFEDPRDYIRLPHESIRVVQFAVVDPVSRRYEMQKDFYWNNGLCILRTCFEGIEGSCNPPQVILGLKHHRQSTESELVRLTLTSEGVMLQLDKGSDEAPESRYFCLEQKKWKWPPQFDLGEWGRTQAIKIATGGGMVGSEAL